MTTAEVTVHDIPDLLHDASLATGRWDRGASRLVLVYDCLRRNVDGSDLDDRRVAVVLDGVAAVAASYDPFWAPGLGLRARARRPPAHPARQNDAFKVFRDHLDAMNTMNGFTVSLPPKFQHSSFEVIGAMKKNRPALTALIECPDKRPTDVCVFSVRATIENPKGIGHYYGKRAIARAKVVRTRPHPTKPNGCSSTQIN